MRPSASVAAWVLGLAAALVPRAAAPAEPSSHAQAYFGEIELVSQDGRPLRLYSDLLHGKTVVIHSFFASCQGACPRLTGSLRALQERFGERLEQELRLISISVDPADTPETLREHARSVRARPGWYFLTGPRENVERALRKLGQFTEDKNAHPNVLLIGNLETGLWKKAFGLAPPDEIAKVVASVLDDPSPASP